MMSVLSLEGKPDNSLSQVWSPIDHTKPVTLPQRTGTPKDNVIGTKFVGIPWRDEIY
jgi:hypothetical protein